MKKPPSLSVKPNIPWEEQTIEQLKLERAWWEQMVKDASGAASASAAWGFMRACDNWITRKQNDAEAAAMKLAQNRNRRTAGL